MVDARFEDLVEIYGAATSVEADRIVFLLSEENVEALYRETTMSSFPSPVEAHFLICVKQTDADKAIKSINEARRDGAISESGAFLGEDAAGGP